MLYKQSIDAELSALDASSLTERSLENIDVFYNTLISYVRNAVSHVVKKRTLVCVHAIPDWNEIVADKHALARQLSV